VTESPTPIAVAIVEHQDRFLVGLRPEGTALAGFWEFPGGKVKADAGESPAAAAKRECLEETGLAVEIQRAVLTQTERYAHGAVSLQFFACTPVDPQQPPRHPFRWVARDELRQYEFPSGNRQVLELLTGTES